MRLVQSASLALKALGYLSHHPVFSADISGDAAFMILHSLSELIISTDRKALCNLAVWCLGMQHFNEHLLELHIDSIIRAIVHAVDNPMGSLAVTVEALQAMVKLTHKLADKMRAHSAFWAPPLYRRLLAADKREREIAERCLKEVQSVLLPSMPSLMQVVATDIKQVLLSKMEKMLKSQQLLVPVIRAWGWLIRLLGKKAAEQRSMLNEMLKVAEVTFVSHDAQVRIASMVAWEALIDALLPYPMEAKCSDSPAYMPGMKTDKVSTRAPGKYLETSAAPSLKRMKLLMMPMISTLGIDRDSSVQYACWRTWMYLANKLGSWICSPLVEDTVLAPVFEAIFKSGPLNGDPWVWDLCLNAFEEFVGCKTRDKSGALSFSHAIHLTDTVAGVPSPKTPTCKYETRSDFGSSLPIKWAPWSLDRVGFILKVVRVLWQTGIDDILNCMDDNLSLNGALKIWWLVIKGVEGDEKCAVKPSCKHIESVHQLLMFVSDICYGKGTMKIQSHSKVIGSALWSVVEALILEFRPFVLSSSYYKLPFSPAFFEIMDYQSLSLGNGSKDIGDLPLDCGSFKVGDSVTPIIYLTISWLRFVISPPFDMAEEETVLDRTQKLAESTNLGLDIMGNFQGLSFGLNLLQSVTIKCLEKYLEADDAVCLESPLKTGYNLLLRVWKVFADSLATFLENVNDVPAVGGSLCDSGYHVVCSFLVFPLQLYVRFTKFNFDLDGSGSCNVHEVLNDKDVYYLKGGLEFVNATWVKLYDCTSRISSLKNIQTNSFATHLCQRITQLITQDQQEPNKTQAAIELSQSFLFTDLFGTVIVNILKQADISSLAMLAINRKRRLGNFMGGPGPTCGSHSLGNDLDNSSNLSCIISLTSRFMDLSWEAYHTKTTIWCPIVVRVLGALTGFVSRIYLQYDLVMFIQVFSYPLAKWLGSCDDVAMDLCSKKIPDTLLLQLERLWDKLLSSLQKCQPPPIYDSKLLALQAPLLVPTLQHFHDPIASRTLLFWEMTYGCKALTLNYPDSLVPVFRKLLDKVKISLPGWHAASSEKVCKLQADEALGSFLHTYVTGRRRRQMLQIRESIDRPKEAFHVDDRREPSNIVEPLKLGLSPSPTGMPDCKTNLPGNSKDLSAHTLIKLSGEIKVSSDDGKRLPDRNGEAVSLSKCSIVKRNSSPSNMIVMSNSLTTEAKIEACPAIAEVNLNNAEGSRGNHKLAITLRSNKRRRINDKETSTVIGTSHKMDKSSVPISYFKENRCMKARASSENSLPSSFLNQVVNEAMDKPRFDSDIGAVIPIRRKQLKFVDENNQSAPYSNGEMISCPLTSQEKGAKVAEKGTLRKEAFVNGVCIMPCTSIDCSSRSQLELVACESVDCRSGSLNVELEGNNSPVLTGILAEEQRNLLPSVERVGLKVATRREDRSGEHGRSRCTLVRELKGVEKERIKNLTIGEKRLAKKLNRGQIATTTKRVGRPKTCLPSDKIIKGDIKKLGIQQLRFLRSSGCLRGGKDWRITSELARKLPKRLRRRVKRPTLLENKNISLSKKNREVTFVNVAKDDMKQTMQTSIIDSPNSDCPESIGTESPFRVQTLNRGFLARIFCSVANRSEPNKQGSSSTIALGTHKLDRYHHRKSSLPRKALVLRGLEGFCNAQGQESGGKAECRLKVEEDQFKETEKQVLFQQGAESLNPTTPTEGLKVRSSSETMCRREVRALIGKHYDQSQKAAVSDINRRRTCREKGRNNGICEFQKTRKERRNSIGKAPQTSLAESVESHMPKDQSKPGEEARPSADNMINIVDVPCNEGRIDNSNIAKQGYLQERIDGNVELDNPVGTSWHICDILASIAQSPHWENLKLEDFCQAERLVSILTKKIVEKKGSLTSQGLSK